MDWDDLRARDVLRRMFAAAIAAADPRVVLPPNLPDRPRGRCVVVGAGKSAALMAASVEAAWPDVALSGVVVTRYGHAVPTARIEVIEASHPVPDASSQRAAHRIMAAVGGLTPDDLVLALMSGGGSALLVMPAPGISFADKQAVNRALLDSGAPIDRMNTVRKHLSAIKGGWLASAAAPARVVTLAISDVPGDDAGTIASGPTVPDPSTFQQARAVLDDLAFIPPASVAAHLARGVNGLVAETPKPGCLPNASVRLIATPAMALAAAADVAREAGLAPLILGDALEGESREVARVLAGIARSVRAHATPIAAPAVLLSGGETTVTVTTHAGRGGRNTEFALSLAVALAGASGIWALAGDTDGIDGTQDAAGAIVTPTTLARSAHDLRAMLAAHDSFSVFDALGDLVRTGPTLTNVNDFRAVLVS